MLLDGMSFDKYIDNPSGGASVITNRQMYKDLYKSKFEKILLKENGVIHYSVYHADDKNDSYYIYFKIPSEVIEHFYYDVVIHLFTHMMPKKVNMTLRQYQVEFYSNDPAFVYTHVHAFARKHLFIKDLEHKMSSTALDSKAKEKNPKDNIWYVKSLYFAYLAMEKYGLFNRATLNMISKPYDKHIFDNKILHADKKIKDRQEAADKLAKLEKENRSNEIRAYNASRNQDIKTKSSKISKVSKVSKISKISKVAKTTKIK
jgi:hypothetical protein